MSIFDNADWIEKLKAGDTVGVRTYNFGKHNYAFHKVVKLTATQVVVLINPTNGTVSRFHRKNGDQVGRSAWHHCDIVELTPELVTKIKADKRRETLIYTLGKISWNNFTNEELERVFAVIPEKKNLTKDGSSSIL